MGWMHVSYMCVYIYMYTIFCIISSPEHQRLQSSSSSNWSLSTDGEVSYQLHNYGVQGDGIMKSET